jgi:hypothetical protein
MPESPESGQETSAPPSRKPPRQTARRPPCREARRRLCREAKRLPFQEARRPPCQEVQEVVLDVLAVAVALAWKP